MDIECHPLESNINKKQTKMSNFAKKATFGVAIKV